MFLQLIRVIVEGASFFIPVIDGKVAEPSSSSYLFWILVIWGLLFSISIHEFAHAYIANKLGDDTSEDRLTINPLFHFDLFGILLILFTGFGYGKPVPVNPNNFRNPVQGMMFTALAGPASNILIALMCGISFIVFKQFPPGENVITTLGYALGYIGAINISLAMFNMLPFHPLDGSKILGYLHYKIAELIYVIRPYSIFILIFLIYPFIGGNSIFGLLIADPISSLYLKIIGF